MNQDVDEEGVDWPMSLRVLCATITTEAPTEDPRLIDVADDVYALAIDRAFWRHESTDLYDQWARVWFDAISAACDGVNAWD